jgi:hypothetical protein
MSARFLVTGLVTLVLVHPINARDINEVSIILKIVGVLATTIWVLSPMSMTHVLPKDKIINIPNVIHKVSNKLIMRLLLTWEIFCSHRCTMSIFFWFRIPINA